LQQQQQQQREEACYLEVSLSLLLLLEEACYPSLPWLETNQWELLVSSKLDPSTK
jgi:hypothetical protein